MFDIDQLKQLVEEQQKRNNELDDRFVELLKQNSINAIKISSGVFAVSRVNYNKLLGIPFEESTNTNNLYNLCDINSIKIVSSDYVE